MPHPPQSAATLKMSLSEMDAFLAREFPQIKGKIIPRSLGEETVVEMHAGEAELRPGGTVSGPALFTLADVAFYIALLAHIGPEALSVTTNCAIDFMRKPAPGVLRARARLLKLGRQLCVGDVLIEDAAARVVAHAKLTYAIPPKRSAW